MFGSTFTAVISGLILVLNKDALFHWQKNVSFIKAQIKPYGQFTDWGVLLKETQYSIKPHVLKPPIPKIPMKSFANTLHFKYEKRKLLESYFFISQMTIA